MKCKLTEKEWEDNEAKTIFFRQIKERFYAGIWYDKNYWIPTNPSMDKKNQYCIQLSPTISYMVDKDILNDKYYPVNFTKENYIKWVENNWDNFKLGSNTPYPLINSLGINQNYFETKQGTFIESFTKNDYNSNLFYSLYDPETKRTVTITRSSFLNEYLLGDKKIIDVEFEMRKQAIELMEKDKKYNNTNKKTYDPIL